MVKTRYAKSNVRMYKVRIPLKSTGFLLKRETLKVFVLKFLIRSMER